jgi:hypothetical protein
MGATNIFTKTINNTSLSIQASDNVQKLSVLCTAGSITVTGSATFQGISSESIDLDVGQGCTLSASTFQNPLSGVVINAPTGADIAEVILSVS